MVSVHIWRWGTVWGLLQSSVADSLDAATRTSSDTMKYALAFLLVIAAMCCTTAASACQSMKQARAANPGAYLKYKITANQRCWYAVKSSRGGVENRRHAECPQECSQTPVPQGRGRLSGQALTAGVATGPRETNYAGEAPGPSTLAADLPIRASVNRRGGPAPDRVSAAFAAIDYFHAVPWHFDYWLIDQIRRMPPQSARDAWVMAGRWP